MGDVGFRSFDEIKDKYNLSNSEFWRYLQMRHCILSNKHIQHSLTEIQVISRKIGEKNRGASKFFELIRSTQVPKLDGLKTCWEKDLAQMIPENNWKKLYASWHCYSREAQSQLICYKILNRSYWTPSKLARLNLRNSDLCWRCNGFLYDGCWFCFVLWIYVLCCRSGLFCTLLLDCINFFIFIFLLFLLFVRERKKKGKKTGQIDADKCIQDVFLIHVTAIM